MVNIDRYSRWSAMAPTSLAYARFKQDFTTLNSYYWGGASTASAVTGKLRHLTDADDFRAVLGLQRPRFSRSLGHSSSNFASQIEISEAWHRRSTLVVLLSAFERYLAAISALSVASNPTLTAHHLLDGLALQKYAVQPAAHDLESVVKGTWGARAAAYSRMFGSNSVLDSLVGELDRMRNARNYIAHEFGVSANRNSLSAHAALLVGARRTFRAFEEVKVSEKSLLRWFGVVDEAAAAVDEHLHAEHLGSYEVAALFLEWEPDPLAFQEACGAHNLWKKNWSPDRNAKKFLTFAIGSPGVTINYVKSMRFYLETL